MAKLLIALIAATGLMRSPSPPPSDHVEGTEAWHAQAAGAAFVPPSQSGDEPPPCGGDQAAGRDPDLRFTFDAVIARHSGYRSPLASASDGSSWVRQSTATAPCSR